MLCCNVATKPNRVQAIWLHFGIIIGSEDMSIFINVSESAVSGHLSKTRDRFFFLNGIKYISL